MISVRKYNKKFINHWNKFIQSSNNGTLFHNQKFLGYHIDRTFNNHSLIIYKNTSVVAVLPAATQTMNKKNVLYSHPGASYGGVVFSNKLRFADLNNIIQALDRYCYKEGFRSIVLINVPLVYYNNPDESLNYLLSWNQYKIKEQYIAHVVDLQNTKYVGNLLTKRKQRYLNNANDINKFKFVESNNFDEFYKLLSDIKKLYSAVPTHSLDELKKIKNLFPNECKLILSYLNSKIVGGALLFLMNNKTSLVFYNVISGQFRSSQLSTYQLYNCMKISKKLGCHFVDFGVSQTPEQTNFLNPKLSLIKFKEQFGARGVIRTIYTKDF